MGFLFQNNFLTGLASGIDDTQTTITVNDASRVPAGVSAQSPFPLTLVPANTPFASIEDVEIVYVTGVSGSDLTVLRARESTTAKTFAAGAVVSHRLTQKTTESAIESGEFARAVTGGDAVLAPETLRRRVQVITGELTEDAVRRIPDGLVGEWVFVNATTASHTLTLRGESGDGVEIEQGTARTLRSDGSDVVRDVAADGARPDEAISNGAKKQIVVDGVIYPTIQDAVEATTKTEILSPTSSGGLDLVREQVWLPGAEYEETVVLEPVPFKGGTMQGVGIGSHIWHGGAAHTFVVQAENVSLENIWIDHTAETGDFDALHVTGSELMLTNMDVDFAPRYAVYLGGSRCHFVNGEITGGGKVISFVDAGNVNHVTNLSMNEQTYGGATKDALHILGAGSIYTNVTITNVNRRAITFANPSANPQRAVVTGAMVGNTGGDVVYVDAPGNTFAGTIFEGGGAGIFLTSNASNTKLDVMITSGSGRGVAMQGGANNCTGSISVLPGLGGDTSLLLAGSRCSFHVNLGQAATRALQISGSNNYVSGVVDGDVLIQSGGNNNVISAVVTGTVTDNGTGNTTP